MEETMQNHMCIHMHVWTDRLQQHRTGKFRFQHILSKNIIASLHLFAQQIAACNCNTA